MLITDNNAIDTGYELILAVAIVLFIMILLVKLASFLEGLPVIEKKKKKEVVKEVKKEIKKEVESSKEESKVKTEKNSNSNASCGENGYICPYANMHMPSVTGNEYQGQSNYLYDRFVDRPSSIDRVEDKIISSSFLSNEELDKIKNRNVDIRVKDNIIQGNSESKTILYNKINQMTTHNSETREKLLKEFEGLSREMKLLIIENIIQKM